MKTKDKNLMQIRGISTKAVQDVDLASRKVKGYFSAFDSMDSHRDIIRKGAFAKSINDRGVNATGNRRIAHLWQHKFEEPIGKIIELREDDYGLYFVSELINTQKGNDVLTMYQEGVIREHSIGFNYMPDKMDFVEEEDGEGFWEIKEVKLFEGSSVTFGSNEYTPYLGSMKAETIESQIEKLNADLKANLNILKNGKGSDELLQAAEYNICLIQKAYNDLLTTPNPKAAASTLKVEEPVKEEVKAGFFQSLNTEAKTTGNFFNHLIKIQDEQTNVRGISPKEGD